ncbi:high-potential iron-sulfur protein [Endozoicomonas ascidiicola]|uniref:high-potential iron-sulfur protein n=1 Tax=Endozoicomonas ascidiicola TaxID=1698521 RepID=UPI00083674AA|nr:high-potential iron-sulfur protein [Endozoicomonas ascidiicola]
MSDKRGSTRRRFLQMAAATALIPLLNIPSRPARADALPALETTDPTAIALFYRKTQEDAKSVDGFQEGRKCSNCALYVASNSGCALFPGKAVEAEGWCKAWVPKPA